MSDANSPVLTPEQLKGLKGNRKWMLIIGLLTLTLGIIGLGMSVTMTIVSIFYIGCFVFIAGGARFVDAFVVEGWKNKLLAVVVGALYVVAALIIFKNPAASAAWFTLLIALFLIIVGVARIMTSLQFRKEAEGWLMLFLSGVIAILLGILIFSRWPFSGLWVIGTFVSVELVMQGMTTLAVARMIKKVDA